MSLETKNLGLVKSIHVGITPPANLLMLWYDTNTGINRHKFYNLETSTWDVLGGVPLGDKNQVIPIPTPVSSLIITHTLDKLPSVVVVDSTGMVINCQIQYDLDTTDTINITFITPQDGFVILN